MAGTTAGQGGNGRFSVWQTENRNKKGAEKHDTTKELDHTRKAGTEIQIM